MPTNLKDHNCNALHEYDTSVVAPNALAPSQSIEGDTDLESPNVRCPISFTYVPFSWTRIPNQSIWLNVERRSQYLGAETFCPLICIILVKRSDD